MLHIFRTLVLMLALAAPGQVGCDRPIPQANTCWITFADPSYVEYIRPANTDRIRALIEIVRAENR